MTRRDDLLKTSRVSVKAVKTLETMSEETLCFEASLYLDEKLIGGVGNEGRGGSNSYDIPEPIDRSLLDEAVAAEARDRGETDPHGEYVDQIVEEAIERYEVERDARSLARSGATVVVLCKCEPYTINGMDGTFHWSRVVAGGRGPDADPETLAREQEADLYAVLIDNRPTNPKEAEMATQTPQKKAPQTKKPSGRKPAAKATPKTPPAPKRTTPTQRVNDALADHADGAKFDALTDEQKARALEPQAQDGLRGKALATYVLTGQKGVEQTAEAKAEREAKAGTRRASTPSGPREGSSLHAALTVLKDATEPMTPQAIYDEAKKRGLVTGLKGKTPVATLAAQLAVQNKREQLVSRPAPGRYVLRAS